MKYEEKIPEWLEQYIEPVEKHGIEWIKLTYPDSEYYTFKVCKLINDVARDDPARNDPKQDISDVRLPFLPINIARAINTNNNCRKILKNGFKKARIPVLVAYDIFKQFEKDEGGYEGYDDLLMSVSYDEDGNLRK